MHPHFASTPGPTDHQLMVMLHGAHAYLDDLQQISFADPNLDGISSLLDHAMVERLSIERSLRSTLLTEDPAQAWQFIRLMQRSTVGPIASFAADVADDLRERSR